MSVQSNRRPSFRMAPSHTGTFQSLEAWASKYVQTTPLATLDGAVIGVDATYYLDQILNENSEEPLKGALGGTPFCLEARIEEDLQAAKDAKVKLIFVFNGLDYVNKTPSSADSAEARQAHEEGWAHYIAGEAKETVNVFGRAGYPLDLVVRLVRKILHNNEVEFLVAPFSSLAFLSYLYHLEQGQPIDAIIASPDAFLFDIDKIVLSIDSKEQKFSWLSKQDCMAAAGNPSPQLFKDAQLLLGSSFIPTFPVLQRISGANIRDALNMLSRGPPVLQLCAQYKDDPSVSALNYADRYKKAVMTIRHHVIITTDGNVQPMDLAHAPGDVHAFVGQRLPDELFFYISRGILGPQVPNWLTSSEIKLLLPGGPIDCEPYRRFVIDQINPIRLQSVKLLAESLHYYYQGREITLLSWDGRNSVQKVKELLPLKEKVSQWKVKETSFPSSKPNRAPTLLSCLRALKDKDFIPTTFSKGKVEYPALSSQNEIISNVFWRFLHIRSFIDDKHQPTSWGKMLEAALSMLDGSTKREEQAVLAVELLRLGAFNTHSIVGTPVQPTDKAFEHKTNTNLISKIACLGRLRHEPVGYVGPLDRSLLTFAWQISALRSSLRDLCETVLTTLFLNGFALRERDDWAELSQRLPFVSDSGSSLGIAVKVYLDACNDAPKLSEEFKEKVKSQEDAYSYFAKMEDGTIHKSLDTAFKLFDATNAAVKAGEKEVKDAAAFATAEKWLASRR